MRWRSSGGPRRIRIAGVLIFLLAGASWGWGQSGPAGNAAPAQPSGPASGANAQDDAAAKPQIRVQSNLVTAPVTVIDRTTGYYVYDLKKSDFQIYDNGVLQKIQLFDREPHKLAVVVVIQHDDAMAPLMNQIKPLAPLFSQLMLGSRGEAAVIQYAGQVQESQDFSSSADVLHKTFQTITPDGSGARLNDALMQAMNLLEKRPKGERRVIVVLSTGYDSGSSTSKEEVIRRATHAEVEIYGLALSLTKATLTRKPRPRVARSPLDENVTGPSVPGVPSTPSSSQQSWGFPADVTHELGTAAKSAATAFTKNDMESYCHFTGGVFYTEWSAEMMQVHLNEIAAELHSQYALAYVPDDLARSGFHRITVRVNRPDVKVRTRLGYFYEGTR